MDFKKLLKKAMNDTTSDKILEQRINMSSDCLEHTSTNAYLKLRKLQLDRARDLKKEQEYEKIITECSKYDENEFN